MAAYMNTISLIRAILEFHPRYGDIAKKLVKIAYKVKFKKCYF